MMVNLLAAGGGVADPSARHNNKETTQTIPKDLVWVVNRRLGLAAKTQSMTFNP